MGQRLLRAKRKIAHASFPYRVPTVYLVFTEGYGTATPILAEEAVRSRLLVGLMPGSDETRALLALLQHSRRDARMVDGELVTLEHQDRSRLHRAEMDQAFAPSRLAALESGAADPKLANHYLAPELLRYVDNLHTGVRLAYSPEWTNWLRVPRS